MSQHPSLSSSDNDKKQRSVLKRYERISLLRDKEKWKEDDSVFGLPKVRIVKFKVKKEKAVVETAEGEAAPAAGAAPSAGAAAKAAPAAKDGAKPAADSKKEAKK